MDCSNKQSALRGCISDISHLRVLIAGAGIGSVIAERALRMGFRTLSVIDSGIVESRDVSANNYAERDLYAYKAWALTERLLTIDPDATICFSNIDLTPENIRQYVRSYDVVVNALGLNSTIGLFLDKHCSEMGILTVHPYQPGRASLGFCADNISLELNSVSLAKDGAFGEMALNAIEIHNKRIQNQMAADTDTIAWQVCKLLYDVAEGKRVKMLLENHIAGVI